MIVVDTNVMVQLLRTDEDDTPAERLLEQDSDWSAPAILVSELRNVLVGFVRRGAVTERQAIEMAEEASAILGDRITNPPGSETIGAALECGLSAYDAEFVVLARMLEVPLATLDTAILRGAPDVAVSAPVLAQRLEGSAG